MQKYSEIFQRSPLFAGLSPAEITQLLACLNARPRRFAAGQVVFSAGRPVSALALLLEGSVHIRHIDYWGNQSILSEIAPGDIFGEAYALDQSPIPNEALAVTECDVLMLNVAQLLGTCSQACPFHSRTVQNLFGLLARKNRLLVQKLGHMAQRTTREKLLSYLSEQSQRAGSHRFTIPFNRQELADYLAVNRSALSAELSKMQQEGLLTYRKNFFTLA